MHPALHSRTCKVFQVLLYKDNARALLSRIVSILNSDWLQHVRSVRGVYEFALMNRFGAIKCTDVHNRVFLFFFSVCISIKFCMFRGGLTDLLTAPPLIPFVCLLIFMYISDVSFYAYGNKV